jgi:hypothetical protein
MTVNWDSSNVSSDPENLRLNTATLSPWHTSAKAGCRRVSGVTPRIRIRRSRVCIVITNFELPSWRTFSTWPQTSLGQPCPDWAVVAVYRYGLHAGR